MAASFFFYDIETSGLDPKNARIMQFAGQRTDMDLNPIGTPINVLIRLAPDILPEPDAILLTGITPQMTLAEGITEAAFLKLFYQSAVCPDTIFLGYNSVRFDDEFMRYLHYRNFYDAYRWQWYDGCSRWDILDVVRMTRALRPEGIVWPFAPDGKPSNRLELLTKLNKLDHLDAHDALSDVHATIAITRLIKEKQPKLFHYLLDMREKKKVAAFIRRRVPFVHSSGSYSSGDEKTTVAIMVADLPNENEVLLYDLRFDPTDFIDLTVQQLADRWRWRRDRSEGEPRLPVKPVRFNRCPAVAPTSVLDAASEERIHLSLSSAFEHAEKLARLPEFPQKLTKAYELLQQERPQAALTSDAHVVDGQLYDGFLDERDRSLMDIVRAATPEALQDASLQFHDARLAGLWPLYKARNFPDALTDEERITWERLCTQRLLGGGAKSRLAKYFERLHSLAGMQNMTQDKQYVLEELRLYGESIMAVDEI